MSKSKIVDLQKCEDGTYSSKDTLNIKKISKLKGIKPVDNKFNRQLNNTKKIELNRGADEFLSGLDIGLDFVEAFKSRAMRIMRLQD